MALSLRGDERGRAEDAEAFVRQAEQLLGDGQADEGGVDAAVTEEGRQVGQLALRVDVLPVPLEHPEDDEGVPQVVNARSAPTRSGLEACRADHLAEQPLGGHVDVAAPVVTEERCIGLLRQAGPGAFFEVALEHVEDRAAERHAARLEELALADLEQAFFQAEISKLQADDLADPQSRAVRHDEHRIEAVGPQRHLRRGETTCGA
jgi:hypothetical protein